MPLKNPAKVSFSKYSTDYFGKFCRDYFIYIFMYSETPSEFHEFLQKSHFFLMIFQRSVLENRNY